MSEGLSLATTRQAIEEDAWKDVLDSRRSALLSAIDFLISCDCSESIMQEAEKKLKIVDIPETFRFTFALRTVVKSAIAHVKQCDQTSAPVALHVSDRVNCALVRSLPLPERFVYFLLDQLNYSRRDAGLLVGLSDLQTEQLLSQARKRLDDARICEERRLAVNGVRVPLVAIY